MEKKKKKKHKYSDEELSLLENIDKDIFSQYRSIKEDTERFQYQLMVADKKTKKKYKKAIKSGKPFNFKDCDSVIVRKEILKEIDGSGLLSRIIYMYSEWSPIMKLLGRCIALLVAALLSVDIVKSTISKDNMDKLDKIFNLAMSV